jgi:hypothetical protein
VTFTIELNAAVKAAEEVVQEKGAQHVSIGSFYFNTVTNEGGCLVGCVLQKLGFVPDLQFKQRLNRAHIRGLTVWGDFAMDSRTMLFLSELQRGNDHRHPWGSVLETAKCFIAWQGDLEVPFTDERVQEMFEILKPALQIGDYLPVELVTDELQPPPEMLVPPDLSGISEHQPDLIGV